jgi:hypothetical protein
MMVAKQTAIMAATMEAVDTTTAAVEVTTTDRAWMTTAAVMMAATAVVDTTTDLAWRTTATTEVGILAAILMVGILAVTFKVIKNKTQIYITTHVMIVISKIQTNIMIKFQYFLKAHNLLYNFCTK